MISIAEYHNGIIAARSDHPYKGNFVTWHDQAWRWVDWIWAEKCIKDNDITEVLITFLVAHASNVLWIIKPENYDEYSIRGLMIFSDGRKYEMMQNIWRGNTRLRPSLENLLWTYSREIGKFVTNDNSFYNNMRLYAP